MKRVLREPLFHFVVLGALLFAIFDLRSRTESDTADARTIIISAGRIEQLAASYERTWQRPPTDAELKDLVDDFVAEEVLYREAVAMGLDQDDTFIRRRLRQKVEFLTSDLAVLEEPTEEELAAYLAEHPKDFALEPRYTFRQVYLDPNRHGQDLPTVLTALRERLKANTSAEEAAGLGDRLLLPHEFVLETQGALESQLGLEFVTQLDGLPTGQWSGPVSSGYGVHLVLLTERREGRMPELDETRRRVRTRMLAERQEQARSRFLEELLARYRVTIEWPGADSIPGASTTRQEP